MTAAEDTGLEAFSQRAAAIVDKSIKNKGDVRSLASTNGMVRSFEDSISPQIWEGYMNRALVEVDAGNWMNAHEIARSRAISSTALTLYNQSQ